MKPLRVLHVFGKLDRGGAESRTMDIYRNIDRNKIQFDFIVHTQEECVFDSEIKQMGGRIFSVPRFNGKNLLQYCSVWDKIFIEHPEFSIIHGHMTNTAFIYLSVAKKHGVPVRIAHSRSASEENLFKKVLVILTRPILNKVVTNRFAVSKEAGKFVFGGKKYSEGNVNIIKNAIDAGKFIYNPAIRKEMREELQVEDNFVIGHVGRFHYAKNHDFLIDVFAKILEKKSNTVLLLVGTGELEESIKQKARKMGVFNSIKFLGLRSDVERMMQAMDVFVFPSRYEGLPGVVLEAQASGLPCVISDTITDEVKITSLVDSLSLKLPITEWAQAVLAKEEYFRENMYDKIAGANFDIKQQAKKLEKFYLRVLKNCNQEIV